MKGQNCLQTNTIGLEISGEISAHPDDTCHRPAALHQTHQFLEPLAGDVCDCRSDAKFLQCTETRNDGNFHMFATLHYAFDSFDHCLPRYIILTTPISNWCHTPPELKCVFLFKPRHTQSGKHNTITNNKSWPLAKNPTASPFISGNMMHKEISFSQGSVVWTIKKFSSHCDSCHSQVDKSGKIVAPVLLL